MLIDRARWIGAVAGLGPTAMIGAWWAWTGIDLPVADWLVSMGLLATIAIAAGWIAGPLAVAVPWSRAKATIVYAIAVILTTATLSIVQGVADTVSAGDVSVVGLAAAALGRAVVALAGVAYLIVPALVFGAVWTIVARTIMSTMSRGSTVRSSGSG